MATSTSTYARHFASTPPTIHSPAKLARMVSVSHRAADSTAHSGRGTSRQESRCQAQASSDQARMRPIQAVAGSDSQRVTQPNAQMNTGWASIDWRNGSAWHQAGFQKCFSRPR